MNYNIFNSDARDITEIIELFRLVWGDKSNKVSAKTKWAFESEITSKVLILKNSNNEIISVRGGMKWPLVYNNQKIKAYQLHGTCVHPDYRRQGIFSTINKEFVNQVKNEGNQLIFNVSVQNSRLGYEKLGWKYIQGFRRLTKFNKPLTIIKSKLSDNEIERDKTILTIKSEIEIPEDFFIERNSHFNKLIHTEYSINFLKWRLSNEQEDYKMYKSKDCVIIYKTKINKTIKELIIGEVFMLSHKFSSFRKAFNKLNSIENPSMTYTYIFNTHPYYNFYLRLFFTPNPLNYNLHFGTKTLGSSNESILENKKWGLGFLDIDTF